ncbi:uncharacterized protein LOC106054055 [Biomphalaria glabrata]|uniref:Uncharacterized protein LOC106054055 n=1 Tax=Biomphalaria glabrata TaxID=6526 RepID=A0A9W3A2B0_BIOGL|nr:uncharacterized protein LOC106054055 [Biomphalaria glabrata]
MMTSLLIVLCYCLLCTAQNIYRNTQSKSPFQAPAVDETRWKQPEEKETVDTTVVPSVPPVTKQETVALVKDRSPFSPPVKSEWHKTDDLKPGVSQPSAWLSSLQARQSHNTDLIPAISNIDLNQEHHKAKLHINLKNEETKRPKARSKRPKISVYQHRDMHDTVPGVTPWTRYTDKPKVSEENTWSRGQVNAQCGYQSYSPRTQICCQGQVLRRQGIQPSCCGTQTYDNVFNKCCNGIVSFKSAQDQNC